MANMKKVSISGAKIFTFEGDLVRDRIGGILPLTYIGIRLEGAPEDQIWIYKHYFLAAWMEDSYNTGAIEAEPIINAIKAKGTVNLLDDWVTKTNECEGQYRATIKIDTAGEPDLFSPEDEFPQSDSFILDDDYFETESKEVDNDDFDDSNIPY